MENNSQAITEETKKVEEALDQRTEFINNISCTEYNIGKAFEIQGDIGESFNKNQKLQEIDQRIQQSLGNIEKANSGTQDQIAVDTTNNANNSNNTEALNEQLKSKQSEFENQQAQLKEVTAKNTEITQQKQSKEGELNSLQQTKQDLLSNLSPEQIDSLSQNNPELHDVLSHEANIAGETNDASSSH